jgi:endonuclease III
MFHDNPFELTIAVLLSAQTTDVSVNKLTKDLFQKYKKYLHLSNLQVFCIFEINLLLIY